ncbi:hypothetical protein AMTR_s00061p00154840 [Amborella trichopoda]|uniref:Uncharacterized protein n=1 Tax=Amborella trichopoda TaxID=13333 RepID=U5D0L1_AMBTC|nr:hypothetical protein AMTR_s00061p00154840 [Amborella trichopoda]
MEDYPGYNNKRGDGGRCDEPFPLGVATTFKFKASVACQYHSRSCKRPRVDDMFSIAPTDTPLEAMYGYGISGD